MENLINSNQGGQVGMVYGSTIECPDCGCKVFRHTFVLKTMTDPNNLSAGTGIAQIPIFRCDNSQCGKIHRKLIPQQFGTYEQLFDITDNTEDHE